MSALEPTPVQAEDLPAALRGLLDRSAGGPAVDPAGSALVDQAVAVLHRPGFDTLLSLPQLGFQPFDYQQETTATVLRRMRGRAILTDEVGLGKTIEAGLVASELRLRCLCGPDIGDHAGVLPRKAEERKVADFWQLVGTGEQCRIWSG